MAKKTKQKKSEGGLNLKYLGGLLLKKMVKGGAKELRTNADEVNKLNVFPVPDGDTGDNMRMTIESGLTAIENIDSDDLAEIMKALSHGMLLGARGNSGVILSQFFAGISKGLETSHKADPVILGHALEMGVQQAYSSVVTPTEGTILTVAREAVEYATARITPKSTIRSFFADLVKEMQRSLDRTPEALAVLREAGVVDSGGAGLFYIMDGFNRALNGKEVPDAPDAADSVASKPAAPTTFAFNKDSVMTYGYCTEFLLQLQTSKTDIEHFDIEGLKAFLGQHGDSIVTFLVDSIVKVHVHTFTPEVILGHCRQFGEFLTMKIENMSVQHTELGDNVPGAPTAPAEEKCTPAAEKPRKRYGVVAVCNGVGIESLYVELGADVIIRGGQTHNPSTNDFLEAFATINAADIFVFPNNGNILMAAQQAADLYEGATVHVVESKSVATGYAVLSSMDLESDDITANLAAIGEALARVTAGYISPAIRDAEMNGVTVHEGDTIGIIGKEIVVSDADRIAAALALAEKMLALPDKFMLTVFCGADAPAEERAALEAALGKAHPRAEIYFIDGGQEIYPYLFAAE